MPKVAITMSAALHAELAALAERDAPGNPNLSATGLRLLALGMEQEKAQRPMPALRLAISPSKEEPEPRARTVERDPEPFEEPMERAAGRLKPRGRGR